MFATPSQTVPPSCHGPRPTRSRKRSASPATIPFSPRHSNLFCLTASALPTPPNSPSASTSYLLPSPPPAPLLPAAAIFSTSSPTTASTRRRESLGLRSSPMRRSPGMRNMAFFTNAAFEEDDRKVKEYEDESRQIQLAAEQLDGQWFRFQSRSPTPRRGAAVDLCEREWSPADLPDTPASSSEASFEDDAGPFEMDDSSDEEASILPAMRSWREPSYASASASSPISFSSPWGHSASSSLATSVSSFAPSPRCRTFSHSKLAGLRAPELRSATEPRFEADIENITHATGFDTAEVSEGLGLGFGFAI